ncbi:MAG TPA: cellulase family glycosylhydrolase [Chloroflexia bacterium]|nr:cellulase family glycosylhydrolase [Chloroflexia bacterium]
MPGLNHRFALPYRRLLVAVIALLSLQLVLALLGEPLPASAASAPTFMQVQGDRLTLGGQPITLKGSNFYPLGISYAAMWQNWDPDVTRESLQRSQALGNNCVRILIPFAPMFGWTNTVDGSVLPQYLNMLKQFLQMASDYGQRAIVTLFDQEDFAAPGTKDELRQRRYMSDIVTALRNDDRVLAWDLHNEPDNYGIWGTKNDPTAALTWLNRMHSYIKELDPNHLVTIGMGRRESFYQVGKEGLSVLDLSDFISDHSYNADALAEEIYELQERTGRKKPIILEEMGWPTGPSFSTYFNESIQFDKYKKTLDVAKSHGLSGVVQWMLFDTEPQGMPPWDDYSLYYGMIKRNGQEKPVAKLWRDYYSGTALPPAATTSNNSQPRLLPRDNMPHYIPETDHYIGTPLWEMWRRAGGTEIFGNPLTDVFLSEDIGSGRHQFTQDQDKTPIYQYFEKMRLEYHPERKKSPEWAALANSSSLDKYLFLIDVGNIGKELAAAKGYNFASGNRTQADSAQYQWFTQTNHALQEPFLSYWRNHRGNVVLGSPISEPFEEVNFQNGQKRLVQYFEKSRLELVPASDTVPSYVEVGNVGTEFLKINGWIKPDRQYDTTSGLSPDPTTVAPPVKQGQPAQVGSNGFASAAFQQLWQRTDAPVASGQTSRTWLWGAKPLGAFTEPYQDAPGGQRLVQYFDKSRMEINNPGGDQSSKWYVTNGLLVREMISGQVQVGNNNFLMATPAQIPMAGDAAGANPDAPTYASLQKLVMPESKQPDLSGKAADKFLQKDGTVVAATGNLAGKVSLSHFVPDTGHNIASVFWNFLNGTRGPVFEGGKLINGDVLDWVFSVGLPVSEPYWTKAKVAGVERDVLVQAFERRVLTYTPDNPAAFQVEMGNVGLHYLTWRNSLAGS